MTMGKYAVEICSTPIAKPTLIFQNIFEAPSNAQFDDIDPSITPLLNAGNDIGFIDYDIYYPKFYFFKTKTQARFTTTFAKVPQVSYEDLQTIFNSTVNKRVISFEQEKTIAKIKDFILKSAPPKLLADTEFKKWITKVDLLEKIEVTRSTSIGSITFENTIRSNGAFVSQATVQGFSMVFTKRLAKFTQGIFPPSWLLAQ